MNGEYKNKEKRKEYLRQWRLRNRLRLYQYRKDYMERTGKKYYTYKPKGERGEKIGMMYGKNGLGRKYELVALQLLEDSIDMNEYNFQGRHDLEWKGYNIEVKMKNPIHVNGYYFITRPTCDADYYLLFCVKNERIQKILFVSAKDFGKGFGYFAGGQSKYEKHVVFSNEEKLSNDKIKLSPLFEGTNPTVLSK